MNWVKYAAKAVVAGGVAFGGALGTALADGSVTPLEWVVVATTTLVALGAVFGVENGPKPVTTP